MSDWPPKGITPYYLDDSVCIVHGDCRDVLPVLQPVDLVLTDPPYGIGAIWRGGNSHGWANTREQGLIRNQWDMQAPSPALIQIVLAMGTTVIIWGGNYFQLPISRGWLIWNKPERGFALSEAEMAWTNRDTAIRVWDANRSDVGRQHPTQKPISLMRWCIQQTIDVRTILDPFMGSGTTLRAAKDLGRRAIGIEIEEQYCEIAAKRMSQSVLASIAPF